MTNFFGTLPSARSSSSTNLPFFEAVPFCKAGAVRSWGTPFSARDSAAVLVTSSAPAASRFSVLSLERNSAGGPADTRDPSRRTTIWWAAAATSDTLVKS